MKNTRYLYVFKHAVYALLLLILYLMQTVPGLFVLFGQKPILVIPAAVAIAMFEGEFVGGIYGALAGILCDVGGFSLFGFNGFFVCLCCIGIGLLVIYLVHCNIGGCILFVFLTLLIRGSVEYFFAVGMWGYEGVVRLYVTTVLPTVLYSLITTVPLYYLIRRLHLRFAIILGEQ